MRTRLGAIPGDRLIQYHRLYPLLCDGAGRFLIVDIDKKTFSSFLDYVRDDKGRYSVFCPKLE